MSGMEVTAREERTDAKLNHTVLPSEVEGPRGITLRQRSGILRLRFASLRMTREQAPRNKHRCFAFRHEQLLFNRQVVIDPITPARPRLIFERLDAGGA